MSKKKKVITEDMNQMSNNWTSDLSRREMKPTVLTLFDLVKAYDKLKGTDAKAPVILPYPSQFLVQELGELYMKAEEVAQNIKTAARNPLIKDDKQALLACKKALLQTVSIRKSVKQIARFLDDGTTIEDGEE